MRLYLRIFLVQDPQVLLIFILLQNYFQILRFIFLIQPLHHLLELRVFIVHLVGECFLTFFECVGAFRV
jgi:hypothetical protein